jgi:hypothetical protein
MLLKSAFPALVLLCMILLVTGCTGTQNTTAAPAQTAAADVVQVSAVPTTAGLAPSPTDQMLTSQMINVNVEKDYLGNVIVTFQGGNGLKQVTKIDVTLNRADGQVKTASLGVQAGDTATLEGTKDTDRVMVYATMEDGKTYKIVDTLSAYKTRM